MYALPGVGLILQTPRATGITLNTHYILTSYNIIVTLPKIAI